MSLSIILLFLIFLMLSIFLLLIYKKRNYFLPGYFDRWKITSLIFRGDILFSALRLATSIQLAHPKMGPVLKANSTYKQNIVRRIHRTMVMLFLWEGGKYDRDMIVDWLDRTHLRLGKSYIDHQDFVIASVAFAYLRIHQSLGGLRKEDLDTLIQIFMKMAWYIHEKTGRQNIKLPNNVEELEKYILEMEIKQSKVDKFYEEHFGLNLNLKLGLCYLKSNKCFIQDIKEENRKKPSFIFKILNKFYSVHNYLLIHFPYSHKLLATSFMSFHGLMDKIGSESWKTSMIEICNEIYGEDIGKVKFDNLLTTKKYKSLSIFNILKLPFVFIKELCSLYKIACLREKILAQKNLPMHI